MGKKLTKISIAVLSFVCVLCMSIAMIGENKVYAATEPTFVMEADAKVREIVNVNDKQGIYFEATYTGEAPEGAIFGMIIAPTDFLSDNSADWEEELRFGNPNLPEYDAELKDTYTKDSKYFARGECNLDYRGKAVCSFVDIKDYNFDRSFVARAYYRTTNEDGTTNYVYADGIASTNIFTLATNTLAKVGGVSEDTEAYLEKIADTVLVEYTERQVKLDQSELNGGEAYIGDRVSTAGTVATADGSVVLEAGVKPVLYKNGEEVSDDSIYYDEEADKFVLSYTGVFKIGAKIGSKVFFEQGASDLTVKRHDVSVNITAVKRNSTAGTPAKDYTIISKTDVELKNFTSQYNWTNQMYSKSVCLIGEIVDKGLGYKKELRDSDYDVLSSVDWLKLKTDGYTYLCRSLDEKIVPPKTSTVYAKYTDTYGVTYIGSITIHGVDQSVSYGKYDDDFDDVTLSSGKVMPASTYGVEGIKVNTASTNYGLMIKDVELSSSSNAENEQLIRFQAIPTNVGYTGTRNDNGSNGVNTTMYGPGRIYISVIDAEDPTNYVTVAVMTAGSSSYTTSFHKQSTAFVRASNWVNSGSTSGLDGTKTCATNNFASLNAKNQKNYMHCDKNTSTANVSGWASGYVLTNFSLAGLYLSQTENIENYMVGVSIQGSKVYVTNAGTTWLLWDLYETTNSLATSTSTTLPMTPTKNLWYGFGKTADDYAENSATNLAGKKVNICITSALHGKGQEVNYMLIDTIGGTKITKQNSADYMNNMSYEYVGNYFVPQG